MLMGPSPNSISTHTVTSSRLQGMLSELKWAQLLEGVKLSSAAVYPQVRTAQIKGTQTATAS